ncbi:MAG: bifunctional DNA-formamidopyrimidine glycosylase/DNA-(apurinic or apyrimidinic site) lyase [Nitratireductor sp.]
MPELPEVETVKRGLAPFMEGAVIEQLDVNRPNLRFAFPENFSKRVEGQTLTSLSRRAKFLIATLSSNEVLVMHLGMSGSFRIEMDENEQNFDEAFHLDKSKNTKHDHVVFHVNGPKGKARIIYNDPRRFGFMELIEQNNVSEHKYFSKMGIEPIGNSLNGNVIAELFYNKKAPLKAALLDQRLIAGLGNIYACEALHGAGLLPTRPAGSIVGKNGKPLKHCEPLASEIRKVIMAAIEAGGSSLRDHRQADGQLGYFQHNFRVYDQEGEKCVTDKCSGVIARITQSGRSTFYCPKCQK